MPAKFCPPALLDAALEGVRDALQSGELTGCPVTDVAVTVTGVTRQEGLTTAPGCHMGCGAGPARGPRGGLACSAGTPHARGDHHAGRFSGAAINLFTSCGGKVEELEDHGGRKLLRGTAPLRRLFGFSTALRSATQGRAGLVLSFARFDLP